MEPTFWGGVGGIENKQKSNYIICQIGSMLERVKSIVRRIRRESEEVRVFPFEREVR